MTNLPDSIANPVIRSARSDATDHGYRIEETYWGYRVVPLAMPQVRFVVLQSVALISGAACLAAAATLVFTAESVDLMFRLPIIVIIAALGFAMMYFASRGMQVQIEVDTINGEVREVVCNRTGGLTVLGRYGFDCIGSVFLQRGDAIRPTLVLRYRNTARTMSVASGPEPDMARLRDRLGRDLIVCRDAA